MARLARAQATRNAQAPRTPISPAGIGRRAVRATLASMSRSTMSLKAQPAARIRAAPAANRASRRRLGPLPAVAAASATPCQPGSISSQIPVGRSRRPSFGAMAATPGRGGRPSWRRRRREAAAVTAYKGGLGCLPSDGWTGDVAPRMARRSILEQPKQSIRRPSWSSTKTTRRPASARCPTARCWPSSAAIGAGGRGCWRGRWSSPHGGDRLRAAGAAEPRRAWSTPRSPARAHANAAWIAWAFFVAVYLASSRCCGTPSMRFFIPLATRTMREMTNEGFAGSRRSRPTGTATPLPGATVRRLSRAMWGYDVVADGGGLDRAGPAGAGGPVGADDPALASGRRLLPGDGHDLHRLERHAVQPLCPQGATALGGDGFADRRGVGRRDRLQPHGEGLRGRGSRGGAHRIS